MVEAITDMPAGTLGFKLSGRVTKDECFRIVLLRVCEPGRIDDAKAWLG